MINHKLKIYIKHLHFTSLQSQYTFTQLLPKVFLDKYNKTFSCDLTWSIMSKCIMKKNWTCSAAPLEITLGSCFIRQFMRLIVLLRTHFKPPSSVCNNFLLRSHVEFGRLLLLKYAIYSLLLSLHKFSGLHIHLKKITYKPYSIVILCLLSYIIYSGCCHVYFCCVKALTCMLWVKFTLLVMLQPPLCT